MGCSSYGQMTAGGWMYIGPQGIVHGTFNTILNAGRKYLGVPEQGDLSGHLFVTSGLGGMSGAQPKAIEIARGVGIVAEVDASRIETRHSQGWVSRVAESPAEAFEIAHEYMEKKEPMSIAFHGNIVDLLQYAVDHNEKIELLSDAAEAHGPRREDFPGLDPPADERKVLLQLRRVGHPVLQRSMADEVNAVSCTFEVGGNDF